MSISDRNQKRKNETTIEKQTRGDEWRGEIMIVFFPLSPLFWQQCRMSSSSDGIQKTEKKVAVFAVAMVEHSISKRENNEGEKETGQYGLVKEIYGRPF